MDPRALGAIRHRAVELHRPGSLAHLPNERLQQRGLARADGPDDGRQLAPGDLHVDVLEREDLLGGLGGPLGGRVLAVALVLLALLAGRDLGRRRVPREVGALDADRGAHRGVLGLGVRERLGVEDRVEARDGVLRVRDRAEREREEHERHAQQLEERQRREDVRRVERVPRERVHDEGEHGREHRQRDRDGVVRGADDQQVADVPVRTKVVSTLLRPTTQSDSLELLGAEVADALQVGDLPGKVLDDLHPTQELLEQLRALVRPQHRLLAEAHEPLHDARLDRRRDDEERVPGEGGGPEVDEQQHEADDHLDGRDPREVEEAAAKVDARDVRGDVVDELAVRERRPRARGEPQGAVVYRRDEPAADEHAGGRAAVEEVVLAERGEELHDQKTDGEADALAHGRNVVVLASAVRVVRLCGKVDEGLCKRLLVRRK